MNRKQRHLFNSIVYLFAGLSIEVAGKEKDYWKDAEDKLFHFRFRVTG